MGQTVRRTRTYEVAIALEDCSPLASGHERKQAGDIIAIRPVTAPQAGKVGSGERHRYLWLQLELTDEQAAVITNPATFEKRQYRIALERLAQHWPTFSVSRARNTADLYQPFCLPDDDSPFEILTRRRPFAPEGLVQDIATGKYL